MAAELAKSITLQVIHGNKKYEVHLNLPPHQAGDALCVKHLSEAVFDLTEIPEDAQRLIYKGKSLKNPAQELLDVGLVNGAKVMLIGKKNTLEEDADTKALHAIENSVEMLTKKISIAAYELDGIHRGFLKKELEVDAVRQKEKQLGGLTENLMMLLEQLDALRFDESNKGGRGKRKTLVKEIQGMLDRVDGLTRGIQNLLENKES